MRADGADLPGVNQEIFPRRFGDVQRFGRVEYDYERDYDREEGESSFSGFVGH